MERDRHNAKVRRRELGSKGRKKMENERRARQGWRGCATPVILTGSPEGQATNSQKQEEEEEDCRSPTGLGWRHTENYCMSRVLYYYSSMMMSCQRAKQFKVRRVRCYSRYCTEYTHRQRWTVGDMQGISQPQPRIEAAPTSPHLTKWVPLISIEAQGSPCFVLLFPNRTSPLMS